MNVITQPKVDAKNKSCLPSLANRRILVQISWQT